MRICFFLLVSRCRSRYVCFWPPDFGLVVTSLSRDHLMMMMMMMTIQFNDYVIIFEKIEMVLPFTSNCLAKICIPNKEFGESVILQCAELMWILVCFFVCVCVVFRSSLFVSQLQFLIDTHRHKPKSKCMHACMQCTDFQWHPWESERVIDR